MDLEEYRFLDGWSKDHKKGSTRCDRIPIELIDEISIRSLDDYQFLVPDTLTETFTSRDYKKETGISLSHAQTALNILTYVGATHRVGKKGNAYLYQRTDFASGKNP